jgi:hypothetical protein
MTQLSSFNIVIIDYPGACDLRARLVRSGATVHVLSAAASIVLARQKRIDAVFVGFSVDAGTVRLCEHLKDLGVSQIIVAPADAGEDHANHRGIVPLLSATPPVLRIDQPRRATCTECP